ncbi:hypothetical protein [Streptomyces sp. NBC_00271]|uniref:hypothetical protein n=1 Tax=Streptomyces sp. NBC_00271 TaxID=2975697 RepID=UPI002E2CFF3B|nr:hypothetical protein [Streptomyces sp. NBC_00271]
MKRIDSLTPELIEQDLERLDWLDRRDDVVYSMFAVFLFLIAAALYTGVAVFAFRGIGAATTGCAVFGSLVGGFGAWLLRKVLKRRRIRKRRSQGSRE